MARVTFDDVLACLQLVFESVEFDKVYAVFIDLDVTSVFVVFGTDEHTYNGLGWFFADYVDLVSERFVVKTILASNHLEVVVFVFLFVYVNGVSEINIVLFEVGYETVDFDAFYFYPWVDKFIVGVVRKLILVFLEVEDDSLVQLPESGIAEGSFEEFQSRRSDLVFI